MTRFLIVAARLLKLDLFFVMIELAVSVRAIASSSTFSTELLSINLIGSESDLLSSLLFFNICTISIEPILQANDFGVYTHKG